MDQNGKKEQTPDYSATQPLGHLRGAYSRTVTRGTATAVSKNWTVVRRLA